MRHLRWMCAAGLLLAALYTPLRADELQSWLSKKDLAVEAAVRSLVIVTIAGGAVEKGRCFHEQYFGSPLRQRRTLTSLWTSEENNPNAAAIAVLERACAAGDAELTRSAQPAHPEDSDLWARTGNGGIHLDLQDFHVAGVAAAAAMIEAHTHPLRSSVAGCISELRSGGDLGNAAKGKFDMPISIAAHDLLRELCGLNVDKPAAASLSFPAMPAVELVAQERLRIVQDLQLCGDGASYTECALAKYKARARVLWPQLLRKL